jgi:hypothetical protein
MTVAKSLIYGAFLMGRIAVAGLAWLVLASCSPFAIAQDADDPFAEPARRPRGRMGQGSLEDPNANPPGSFKIASSNGQPAILLDTRSGQTWRLTNSAGGMRWIELSRDHNSQRPSEEPPRFHGQPPLVAPTARDPFGARVSDRARSADPTRSELNQFNEKPTREGLLERVRMLAGKMVGIRSRLDDIVWQDANSRYTTTEAAKLLIGFFRGDGTLPGFRGSAEEASELKAGLAELRQTRENALNRLQSVAKIDEANPASPLVGVWEITGVRGAGGVAADALELYDPDPVSRRLVVANDAAALLTGAGFWLFDASYPGDHAVDLGVVVRGDTVYRGKFAVDGQTAALRVSPMNSPRPEAHNGNPTDGGFVLELHRVE